MSLNTPLAKSVLAMAIVSALASYGYFISYAIPGFKESPYNHRNPPSTAISPTFSFVDETSKLGAFEEFPKYSIWDPTYVSIGDVNTDGYEDILWVYSSARSEAGSRIKLLRNEKGNGFKDITKESGIEKVVSGQMADRISAVAFADFDNDGLPDLYVARRHRPHFVLKNVKGRFVLWENFIPEPINGQDTYSVNLFDFNRDGFVDVLFTNVYDFKRIKEMFPSFATPNSGIEFPCTIGCKFGQKSVLLKNNGGKSLHNVGDSAGLDDLGATFASGIGDFSDSGFDDIFIASGFGFDAFFSNRKGAGFERAPTSTLGLLRSRLSMSAEVGDIDSDGKPDIYVSNVSKPGFTKGLNSLWMNRSKNGSAHFDDEAKLRGVDKCGFSWGTKFADFDKDGWLDLFVVNGLFGKGETTKWYESIFSNVAPVALRNWIGSGYKFSRVASSVAGGQRNCVFVQKDNHFVDVSDAVGVKDEFNGRGLAALDFNNDGQEDFLIGNLGATPLLYRGVRQNSNHWLGLSLVGMPSNRDAIGAKVYLRTKKTSQMRSLYPGNGYVSQSSKRLLFGIPENDEVQELKIVWPSGTVQKILSVKLNAYQEVKEN